MSEGQKETKSDENMKEKKRKVGESFRTRLQVSAHRKLNFINPRFSSKYIKEEEMEKGARKRHDSSGKWGTGEKQGKSEGQCCRRSKGTLKEAADGVRHRYTVKLS